MEEQKSGASSVHIEHEIPDTLPHPAGKEKHNITRFENQASGNILSIPQFRKDFGYYYQGDYVQSAQWQSAFNAAPTASYVVGALALGEIADFIGRKWTLVGALAISFAAITMEVVATTNELFFSGKFLNGFSVRVIQSIAMAYIGEIVHTSVRGLATCLVGLVYTLGPIVCALIVNDTGTATSRWAYRAVFCAQYGFAAVSAAFVFFMPESPWWLASRGHDKKAVMNLRCLGSSLDEAENKLVTIKRTLEEIRRETEGASYLECFRKSNLRRTTIAVLSMTGNIISWWLIDRVGRHPVTFWPLFVQMVFLFIIGGRATQDSSKALTGAIVFLLLWCFVFNIGLAAMAYTIASEVPTARLRIKTVSIGLAAQNAFFVMWAFVLPYLFNPDKLNLGDKISFIYAGLTVLCLVYLYFFLPETGGRTYEELDELFMKKVPAREFKGYKTEVEERRVLAKSVTHGADEQTKQ
ncbi:MFS general substrate transporter [Aspergillus pseudocaelatus]|uniref:MFS general substrate transporter n=1 Tax=Aspergillus pseudocaelatus TaxID=1825620 RepID=A0ABQ6WDS7_9EURO|nr:MFS general substrate transporter [Aspergillus pseudocaelatus]